jgi:sugar phosphate isomerase/epimerase
MVNISIVQGRLTTMVGGRYQHFPIHGWRDEFKTASQLGFDGIEWIISDFSNPIFDPISLDQVKEISNETGINISSISLDLLMYNPIQMVDWKDISWMFERLCLAVAKLGVSRISIPVEENSGIRNSKDAELVISRLAKVLKHFGDQIPYICIETDLSVKNICHLINLPDLINLGILLDIGNVAANGYNIDDYFNLCADRIYGVHIKDRGEFFLPNVTIGGGIGEIKLFLNRSNELSNLTSITLQSYRTPDNYINNAKSALDYVRKELK